MTGRRWQTDDAPWWTVPLLWLLAFPLWAAQAWVALKLWRWFIVPLFPSAPVPGLWPTVGLLVAMRYIVGGTPNWTHDPRPWQERVTYAIIAPLTWAFLTLLSGALLRALVY